MLYLVVQGALDSVSIAFSGKIDFYQIQVNHCFDSQ